MIATSRIEKRHCGNSGLPFMNSSTSLPFTFSSIRAFTSSVIVVTPSFGYAGGELERVKLAAHAHAEPGINRPLLHHPRLATETLAHNAGGLIVAVPGPLRHPDRHTRDCTPAQ